MKICLRAFRVMIVALALVPLAACSGGGGGGGQTADTTAPIITSTTPANSASNVAVNTTVSAIFSETMDPATINTSTFTLKDRGNNPVSGVVNYTGMTATFTPTTTLAFSNTYTATITTGAKDLAGNPLSGDYAWTFSTGVTLDTTPPTVITTSPASGASGVVINTTVSAIFSEAMDPATINTSTIILKDSGNNTINGSVSYSGTTATFTPAAALGSSITYTARITSGVKDQAGNAMTSDYTWTFTTIGGSLDTGFGNSGMVVTPVSGGNDWVNALSIQSDNKVVVAGISNSGSGSTVARYNPDGSVDTSFGSGGMASSVVTGTMALGLKSDGNIVVAGGIASGNNYDFAVARYKPDGTIDTSFGSGGLAVSPVSGTYDDIARTLGIQPDGKIVVAGYVSDSNLTYNFFSTNYDIAVVRYNPDGTLDTGFGSGGMVITNLGVNRHDDSTALVIQSDGKIVVAGWSTKDPGTANSNDDFVLVRYNQDGSLDASFGSSGTVITDLGSRDNIYAIGIQSDGKLVVAGNVYINNNYDIAVARYTANGSLDTGFGNNGVVITPVSNDTDVVRSLVIQPDGKVVVAGYCLNGSNFDFVLVRYNQDGSHDTNFGSGGTVITDLGSYDDGAYALDIQSDGKLVAAGRTYINGNYDFALVRYLP